MNTHIRTACCNEGPAARLNGPKTVVPDLEKDNWTQKHAVRILKLWLKWETPLGVARAYASKIRSDLAEFYEDPLKRMFIEATY